MTVQYARDRGGIRAVKYVWDRDKFGKAISLNGDSAPIQQ